MNKKLNCSLMFGPFEVRYTDISSNKEVSKFFSTKRESIEFIRSLVNEKNVVDTELIIFEHHIALREEYFPSEINFSELGKEFNKELCLK